MLRNLFVSILAVMEKTNSSLHQYRLVFAQNLRQVRRLKEISQEELAFAAGISRAYVCEIEQGSRAVSIDVMGRISDALKIPLDKLLLKDLTKIG